MDKSRLKAIVNKSISAMRNALCLNEWKVQVTYETVGSSDHMRGAGIADTRPDPKYMDAWMRIDCDQIDSEKQALDTLRHELLHFIHADLQIVRRAVADMLTEKEFDVYTTLNEHVCERIVHRMEAVLDNLGFSPEELVKKGRNWRGKSRRVS